MKLLIKINDGSAYEDGDILAAFPDNWEFSDVEFCHFLILTVPNTDTDLAVPLLSGSDEEGYEQLKARRYWVEWKTLDGIDAADVREMDTPVDIRWSEYALSVVQDKGE